MPECKGCSRLIGLARLTDGYCESCIITTENKVSDQQKVEEKQAEIDKEKAIQDSADRMMLTTEMAGNFNVIKRIEIVSAECVFGMNVFRDMFSSFRDFFGGRSRASQKVLRDARKMVLSELKKEAALVGGNAVVGVDLDYNEISGKDKSMLLVVATGTAVILG